MMPVAVFLLQVAPMATTTGEVLPMETTMLTEVKFHIHHMAALHTIHNLAEDMIQASWKMKVLLKCIVLIHITTIHHHLTDTVAVNTIPDIMAALQPQVMTVLLNTTDMEGIEELLPMKVTLIRVATTTDPIHTAVVGILHLMREATVVAQIHMEDHRMITEDRDIPQIVNTTIEEVIGK